MLLLFSTFPHQCHPTVVNFFMGNFRHRLFLFSIRDTFESWFCVCWKVALELFSIRFLGVRGLTLGVRRFVFFHSLRQPVLQTLSVKEAGFHFISCTVFGMLFTVFLAFAHFSINVSSSILLFLTVLSQTAGSFKIWNLLAEGTMTVSARWMRL